MDSVESQDPCFANILNLYKREAQRFCECCIHPGAGVAYI